MKLPLKKWGEDVWASDPYGRNFAGTPPAKWGDYAWVQHMIKSMAAETGRMAVVLPQGGLFRMGAEGKIREKILGMDLLDAVINLGPNLFFGSDLVACILVFRQKKPKQYRKKVLIVDASQEIKKGRAQNELLPEHVNRIFGWYSGHGDIDGIARLVPLDEIRANDWNLNIPRYIDQSTGRQTGSVSDAMNQLARSLEAAATAEERLKELMRQWRLL